MGAEESQPAKEQSQRTTSVSGAKPTAQEDPQAQQETQKIRDVKIQTLSFFFFFFTYCNKKKKKKKNFF